MSVRDVVTSPTASPELPQRRLANGTLKEKKASPGISLFKLFNFLNTNTDFVFL
jgi:hypothetical protein